MFDYRLSTRSDSLLCRLSLILLRVDGYPCVFLGDLEGCGGDDPQPPVTQLEDFIRARKWYSYGELRDYSDHPNCLGWVRMGDEEHPDGLAVVLSNGGEGTKRMEVGKVQSLTLIFLSLLHG